MKELSIEEKAKRYDEAIEIAKEINNEQRAQPFNIMTRVFPELKESEDERIRKGIIRCVKGNMPDNDFRKKYIAWLEKQGEQKTKKVSLWKHWKNGVAGNVEGKLIYLVKVGNTYRLTSCLEFECDYIELSELDNLMLKKQGEQKGPKYKYLMTQEEREAVYELKTSDWSEEDKEMIDNIIDYMTPMPIFFESTKGESGKEYTQEFIIEATNWLKSLKDRVQPQQEWNEEDEYCRHQLIVFCENCMQQDSGAIRCANWLKSLRPQSQWKPTKEQINVLNAISNKDTLSEYERGMLCGLYTELKKLTEE